MEEPGRLQSMGLQESGMTEVTEAASAAPTLMQLGHMDPMDDLRSYWGKKRVHMGGTMDIHCIHSHDKAPNNTFVPCLTPICL